MFSALTSKLFLMGIAFYQNFLSPVLPARCRYYPTCSEYSKTAIKWHGPRIGGVLMVKRIARCHPLGGHGIDFVPLPLYKDTFYPLLLEPSGLPSTPCISKDSYLTPLHTTNQVSRETFVLERGVYTDISSYRARLNRSLSAAAA